ncbi:MAG: response regulator [Myxococcota bacterium]
MQCSILIVDDLQSRCQLLIEELQSQGYQTEQVFRPSKALEKLRTQTFQIVLVSDLLPEMNGLDLIQEMRREHIDIAVLFMASLPIFLRDVRIHRTLTKTLNVHKVLPKRAPLSQWLSAIEAALEQAKADLHTPVEGVPIIEFEEPSFLPLRFPRNRRK